MCTLTLEISQIFLESFQINDFYREVRPFLFFPFYSEFKLKFFTSVQNILTTVLNLQYYVLFEVIYTRRRPRKDLVFS